MVSPPDDARIARAAPIAARCPNRWLSGAERWIESFSASVQVPSALPVALREMLSRGLRQRDPGVHAGQLRQVVVALPDHLVAGLGREILERNGVPQQQRTCRRRLADPAAHQRRVALLRRKESGLLAVGLAAVVFRPRPEDRRHIGQISRRLGGRHRLAPTCRPGRAPRSRDDPSYGIGKERSGERIARSPDTAPGRRSRLAREPSDVPRQCPEIPGDPLRHQVPGAILEAVDGVRLPVDQRC